MHPSIFFPQPLIFQFNIAAKSEKKHLCSICGWLLHLTIFAVSCYFLEVHSVKKKKVILERLLQTYFTPKIVFLAPLYEKYQHTNLQQIGSNVLGSTAIFLETVAQTSHFDTWTHFYGWLRVINLYAFLICRFCSIASIRQLQLAPKTTISEPG